MDKKNCWKTYDEKALQEIQVLGEKYKECLNAGKTERECIALSIQMAEAAGYRNLDQVIAEGTRLKAGDKVYAECMKKSLALFRIGEEPLENGMNIVGSHVDSPRLDVKANPLYEAAGMAYLDTHYYGGVKKYQWVTVPLAIHGVIVKKDGECINVAIGEKEEDPVFVITDLLIHLSAKQLAKTADVVIEGEGLDLLIGSKPIDETDLTGDEKELVKANVLKILKDTYGVEEEDFLSAELELVPAAKARDLGFDRGMILSYGHDDRVCAFSSLFAMFEIEDSKRTACCLLADKEEIGSVGATGMESNFFVNTVRELVALTDGESELKVARSLKNSRMLSSDVGAGFDPLYADAFEKKNAAFMGNGLVLMKFTGSGGKGRSNDANAEYIGALRQMFDADDVHYQFAELGKVDVGGGGTIAYILAKYGMEVIDAGVAVLSMHATMEAISKADFYEAYKAYKVFYKHTK